MANKPFTLTVEQRDEICRRYQQGESTVVLAKAFGVTVVKRLRYGGLRQCADILTVLYRDASVYLDRKKRLADAVILAADSQKSRRRDDGLTINRA